MAQPDFREWLVQRLAQTRHARRVFRSDAQLAKYAATLGVEPDTLREAIVLQSMNRIEGGYAPPLGTKRPGSGHYQFRLWFPQELMPAWRRQCERRHMAGPVLLRGLIHYYLMSKFEPKSRTAGWFCFGKSYQARRHDRVPEVALVPGGARAALNTRAQRAGMLPTGVVRALVCELLEGQHPNVLPIDAKTMYDDPARYNLGETA